MTNLLELLYALQELGPNPSNTFADPLIHKIKTHPQCTPAIAEALAKCCVRETGYVMAGADFTSLEDKISALTTKDPNKLKVYTDGYDGHSLRAYYYFRDQLLNYRQATEEEHTYLVKVKGQDVLAKSGDFVVQSNGTKLPIEEYYEANKRL